MTPPALPGQRDQHSVDAGQLDLLAIFHFVLAGFTLLGLGFLFMHWFMMHTFMENPAIWENAKSAPPPKEFMAVFKWFYLFMGVCIVIMGVANFIAGLCIRKRRCRTLTIAIAGLDCMMVPFGTVLGVFTIIVLARDSVRRTYEATDTSSSP
jgi:hypothetical protein